MRNRVFLNGRGQPFEPEPPEIPASVVLLVEYSRSSWLYLDIAGHKRKDFKVRVRETCRSAEPTP